MSDELAAISALCTVIGILAKVIQALYKRVQCLTEELLESQGRQVDLVQEHLSDVRDYLEKEK